jgi:hypothetical protein
MIIVTIIMVIMIMTKGDEETSHNPVFDCTLDAVVFTKILHVGHAGVHVQDDGLTGLRLHEDHAVVAENDYFYI